MPLNAVIFDFDGVIVDSEPLHFEGFRRVLAGVGIDLTEEAYYTHYLGYGDDDCFRVVSRDRGVELGEAKIEQLIAEKTDWMQKALAEQIAPLPGATALIGSLANETLPLAICSGALREEILIAARTVGVLDAFELVVAAEDVSAGKPDPEGYHIARERLSQSTGNAICSADCVVIEDSPAGISAAKGAGIAVLAVATSYEPEQLTQADRIVQTLETVTPADLRTLLQQ